MRRMSERGSRSPFGALPVWLASAGLDARAPGNGAGDRHGVHEHGCDTTLVAAAGSITSRPAPFTIVDETASARMA